MNGIRLFAISALSGAVFVATLHAQPAPRPSAGVRERAFRHIEKGELDAGIADLGKVLEANPRDAEAWFARGVAWAGKKDADNAIADFSRAIALAPTQMDPYYNRACIYMRKADYEKALADLREALRLAPDNFRVCNNLAWIQATCPDARYRDGEQAIANALRANRLYGSLHWRNVSTVAAAYAEHGDFTDARHWQTEAIGLVNADPDATDDE